ncbi:MAG: sigma 54-interacting transcriptional regulator [Acidobacteriota bacterium]
MIEAIKNKLWNVLRKKDVSLAMVCDREERILWHRGRRITGRTLADGEGFPKSLIRETISLSKTVQSEDVVVMSSADGLPHSAGALYLRSILILPFEREFFLYLDSGSKEGFSDADIEVFRAMSELLGETVAQIRRRGKDPGGIAGSSTAMDRVRELVVNYALEEESVLLLGETGVGKNHVAELIHRASGRTGKLVVVHCPSIPESLFESEIFGHRRGAFTGATEARRGLIQEADGGTLMLDEVSEVPLSFQAKLLAFSETGRYRILGDSSERQSTARLLVASNRELAEEVREKRFRSDLYFRLNVLPIAIPPLRKRPADIRDLVRQHIVLLRGKKIENGFFEALERHSWPGNVRELIQVLKRAGIQLPGATIGSQVEQVLMSIEREIPGDPDQLVTSIETSLDQGASFWDTAWKAFLDRDLNREQLQALLKRLFVTNGHSLRRLSEAVNIEDKDYSRFVSSLHKYKVHPNPAD